MAKGLIVSKNKFSISDPIESIASVGFENEICIICQDKICNSSIHEDLKERLNNVAKQHVSQYR